MDDLFQIVYCSRNVIEATHAASEIEQILHTAQRNNARQGVTGALLYNDGIFAQVLEGPFDAVQQIFERIQVDPRHDDVVVLQASSLPHRSFAGWAMAHAEPHDPDEAGTLLSGILAGNGGHHDVVALLERVVSRRGYATAPA